MVRIGTSIPDIILRTKVKHFLKALPNIPVEDKQRLYDDVVQDPKKRRKIGEVLLLLLDHYNDLEKPEILAKFFAAYMKGIITFEQFRRLGQAIDLAYVEDLKNLITTRSNHMEYGAYQEALNNLVRSGLTLEYLVETKPRLNHDLRTRSGKSANYLPEKLVVGSRLILTDLGNLYVKVMLPS